MAAKAVNAARPMATSAAAAALGLATGLARLALTALRAAARLTATAANGGDNLGVYIPVFARDLGLVPVSAAVFAVMTAVWCVVGRALVTHRLVAATMRRLAASLLPYVLIGLGLWILSDATGLVWPASKDSSAVPPPAWAGRPPATTPPP